MLKLWFLVITAICVIIWFFTPRIEMPEYQILNSSGNIEHRSYKSFIVASVIVSGERVDALKQGFKKLAAYISHNKIPMTAPVHLKQVEEKWKVSFIMPKDYSIINLTQAPGISFEELKPSEFIVIRFSGLVNSENKAKYLRELMQYVQTSNLLVVGEPIYAFYNPPWTLPFLRRNEIMLMLKRPET